MEFGSFCGGDDAEHRTLLTFHVFVKQDEVLPYTHSFHLSIRLSLNFRARCYGQGIEGSLLKLVV